jgi:Histidine phosphatase superfamily (branch 2)
VVVIGVILYFSVTRGLLKDMFDEDYGTFAYVAQIIRQTNRVDGQAVKIKVTCDDKDGHLKGSRLDADCGARLQLYCHERVADNGVEGIYPATAKEAGKTTASTDLELKYVLLTIRHGDRSAIHAMPGSKVYSTRELQSRYAESGQKYIDPAALQYAHRLSSYELIPLKGTSNVSSSPSVFIPPSGTDSPSSGTTNSKPKLPVWRQALNGSLAFVTSDYLLPQGQLTTRGFMQHIQLGTHLGRAYEHLISHQIKAPTDIYIRSTNYERTIKSVTALMIAMMPNIGGPLYKGQVPILSYIDEGDEVMHGVGLRLSSHVVDSKGEQAIEGACAKASKLAVQQRDSFIPTTSTESALENIFGSAVAGRAITDIADSSLPKICHNDLLPCSTDSSKGCLTPRLLSAIMNDADRSFCERYSGDSGGKEATKLSIFPFMDEVSPHNAAWHSL